MEDNIITKENQEIEVEEKKKVPVVLILVSLAVVVLGTLTGFGFSRITGNKGGKAAGLGTGKSVLPGEKLTKGQEFGIKSSAKRDTSVGVVEKGGIDGEGTHKLLREGGPSQTVYITSSALDLDRFIGVKIQVWGETNRAQKAGWLMDVVYLKVLD